MIMNYGCSKLSSTFAIRHNPADLGMETVNRLFLAGAVVGVIDAALAKKGWQVLTASVDLNKPALFVIAYTE